MSKPGLIHIRIGTKLKKKMKRLIERGIYSTEAEIACEAILAYMMEVESGDNCEEEI